MVRLVLLRLIESYFRHRFVYIVPVIIMLGAGAAYITTTPPTYTSSGTLYVEQASVLASLTGTSFEGSWWVTPAQTTINEINDLLSTKSFLRSIIQRTNLEARMTGSRDQVDEVYYELRSMIWLNPQGEKLVMLGATSEDPQLPHQIVNAVLEAYVQWKINADYQESLAAQNFFANQIKPYEEEEQRARDDLVEFLLLYPEPVRGTRPPEEQMELDRLRTTLAEAEDRVKTTLNNEESARLSLVKSESVTRQTYKVIDAPEQPRDFQHSRREQLVTIVIALGIGLVIAFAAVMVSALLDRTFRFGVDIRYGLNLPVLTVVPTSSPLIQGVMHAEATSPQAGDNVDVGAGVTPTVPELRP